MIFAILAYFIGFPAGFYAGGTFVRKHPEIFSAETGIAEDSLPPWVAGAFCGLITPLGAIAAVLLLLNELKEDFS